MTIDEAIEKLLNKAEEQEYVSQIIVELHREKSEREHKDACDACAADHRQLAEWLTELKEAKRLLKAAVNDFAFVSENFINNMDSFCSMYNHISGCAKGCPMSGSDDYGRCKWRYADEALKLIGGEIDG